MKRTCIICAACITLLFISGCTRSIAQHHDDRHHDYFHHNTHHDSHHGHHDAHHDDTFSFIDWLLGG